MPIEGDIGARLAAQAPRLRLLLAHLCGRAVRRRVEIDDLVQEVFVRALQSESTLPALEHATEGGNPEPGLYRALAHIARHVVIDCARALRATKREGALDVRSFTSSTDLGSSALSLATSAAGPATAAARAESARDLVAAYERLEPDHRRVLGLRQFEGLAAADCGRRMGRSEAAIHSLYRRALDAWAVELEKAGKS